jgi:hypothetical protein
MIVTGVAFLLFAALIQFFALTVVAAGFVAAIIFVALGLVLGERFPVRR